MSAIHGAGGLPGPPDIDGTSVTLRFFGDDLDPDELSRLLGSEPTLARRKGDPLADGSTAETGSWLLSSQQMSRNAIEAQLHSLFDRLTPELHVWSKLADRYHGDVFCGLWAAGAHRGTRLSVAAIGRFAERKLAIAFDVNFVDDPPTRR